MGIKMQKLTRKLEESKQVRTLSWRKSK